MIEFEEDREYYGDWWRVTEPNGKWVIASDQDTAEMIEDVLNPADGPVRTYYRSITTKGDVWCESRDPEEVRRRSSLLPHPSVTIDRFERFDVYEFGTDWKRWDLP